MNTVDRKKPETNPVRKFQENPTRSKAIHAMCATCMGCTEQAIEPGFRGMIRDCTSVKCPLHSFRPYQRDDAEGDDA